MTPEFHRDDRWWVSPFNVTDEVRRSFSLPPRVQIHDATLRDGEQTPGVVFSVADKIAIAEALAAVGVDRIEAGMPAVSDDDFEAVRQITKLGLPSRIYTFVRAMAADIDKSLECGARGVILEIPIGYPKLLWQFKWTWEDVLRKSVEVVRYAKAHDLEVVYFPYDTTRAPGGSHEPPDAPGPGCATGFSGRRRHDGMCAPRRDEISREAGEAPDQRASGRSAHAQ